MTRLTGAVHAILLLVAATTVAACGRTPIGVFSDTGGAAGTGGARPGGCTTNADCPGGEQCNPTTHACVPTPRGCTSDAQCAAPTPHCRLDTMTCAECVTSGQCPSGEECSSFQCVGFCGGGGACADGLTCCSPLCVSTATNPLDCGACGNACGPFANAIAGCASSACDIAGCVPGFADCDGVVANGCETSTGDDPNNCGGCGKVCPASLPACSGGTCVGTCSPSASCTAGQTCCGATCANTTSDDKNCGACGVACGAVPNGQTSCEASACAITSCTPGFADCNHQVADGCEVKTLTDPNDCGTCANACGANATCVSGVCQPNQTSCETTGCSPGLTCCGVTCVDTTSDATDCGGCGIVCAPGSSCSSGTCAVSCNGGPGCARGATCCADGCRDTSTDPKDCGGCGLACAMGDTCVDGGCVAPTSCNGGPLCASGDTCCATGCTNLTTDPSHCGGCGTLCSPTESCVGGSCVPSEGAFDPTVNPTYLAPGAHSFTSINVPAGVTVYVAGGGAQSGTLDLRSGGPIVIAGTIDLSGGPGTQDVVSSRSTWAGRAGSGGYTGEPYQSALLSAECGFVAGNPGQLGMGVAGSNGTCSVISTTDCQNLNDPATLIWTAPIAQFGGGAGVFTGYRAYASGGGGPAGGAPGALCPPFTIMGGEPDCSGVSGGGGAIDGNGGNAGIPVYDGVAGATGVTQCHDLTGVGGACIGGGGGGSIGIAAAADLAVLTTFQTGSGGGGGSCDYYERPVFGGTSGGGGGGGALRLSTPSTITVTGQLLANGGAGGDARIGNGSNAGCNPQPGAAGGGGSGGVLYLAAPTISVASGAVISAVGGQGGAGSEFATGGAGGAGGLGRIRLSVAPSTCTLGGTWSPPLASACDAASAAGSVYVGVYPN